MAAGIINMIEGPFRWLVNPSESLWAGCHVIQSTIAQSTNSSRHYDPDNNGPGEKMMKEGTINTIDPNHVIAPLLMMEPLSLWNDTIYNPFWIN